VNLTHGFQQQILQRGVKFFADEQPVSQSKQVNVASDCRAATQGFPHRGH
jgi:hypothetical protein